MNQVKAPRTGLFQGRAATGFGGLKRPDAPPAPVTPAVAVADPTPEQPIVPVDATPQVAFLPSQADQTDQTDLAAATGTTGVPIVPPVAAAPEVPAVVNGSDPKLGTEATKIGAGQGEQSSDKGSGTPNPPKKPVGVASKKALKALSLINPIKSTNALEGELQRATVGVEKPILKFIEAEAAIRGIPAAEIWREAMSTKIPEGWWAENFTAPGITPARFFAKRHKDAGRGQTTVHLPATLVAEIAAEREALVESQGTVYGPHFPGTVMEARALLWILGLQAEAQAEGAQESK